MMAAVLLIIGLIFLLYGIRNDDLRILLGILFIALSVSTIPPHYDTYLCEGVEGLVRAERSAKRRWTLSNGTSYHSIDFREKCRKVPPPGLLDAEPLISGGQDTDGSPVVSEDTLESSRVDDSASESGSKTR